MSSEKQLGDQSYIQRLVEQYEDAINNKEEPYFEEGEYEKIIDFFEEQNLLQKALEVASMAVLQFSYSSTFLTRKAQIYIELKQFKAAENELELASMLAPNDHTVLLIKADIYVQKGQHRRAVNLIMGLINDSGKDEKQDLYLELADVFEDWDKYKKVIECLERVLLINPENEEALSRIWLCTELTERFEESIEFHKKLIDRKPYCYQAWINLGHAYSGIDLFEKSIEAFEYAIAIDDKNDEAYIDCAEILVELKRYEEAIIQFDMAIKLGEPDKLIYLKIAKCFFKIDEVSRARYYCKKAISLDPRCDKAFFQMGNCYMQLGDFYKAISQYERAVKIEERNPLYHKALGRAYNENKEYGKAYECFLRCLKIKDTKSSYWIGLAKAILGMTNGNTDEALEVFYNIELKYPFNVETNYIKSVFLYIAARKQASLAELEAGLVTNYKKHKIILKLSESMIEDDDVYRLIELYNQNK